MFGIPNRSRIGSGTRRQLASGNEESALQSIRVLPALIVGALLLGAPAAVVHGAATTFTVTKTADTNDGTCDADCSLREAITAANANAGTDTIAFAIPGGGPHTISPTSALPTITDPVIIDGYTQPGASANTNSVASGLGLNTVLKIELDGTNAGVGCCPPATGGLVIASGGSTVRGLAINRMDTNFAGIMLDTNGGNVIEGNYIGTDVTGTLAIGAGRVEVRGQHNFAGGTTEEERNIVAGGVSLSGGAVYNFVAGNYIGTDVTGTVALRNHVGISVRDAEHNAIHANLVSGSEAAGVQLSQGASFNWLRANRITRNSNIGIEVTDGGGEGNLIVGNSLIDNRQNGYDGGQNNHWDDGQQGNYWSDYEGVDADGDGTGDTPYPIPPNGEDQYPIMALPQPT